MKFGRAPTTDITDLTARMTRLTIWSRGLPGRRSLALPGGDRPASPRRPGQGVAPELVRRTFLTLPEREGGLVLDAVRRARVQPHPWCFRQQSRARTSRRSLRAGGP